MNDSGGETDALLLAAINKSGNITEAQMVLLCLDHLRSLVRRHPTENELAQHNLSSNFILVAIYALNRCFLENSPLSNIHNGNDPYYKMSMNGGDETVLGGGQGGFTEEMDINSRETKFTSTLTTLPSTKRIQKEVLCQEDDEEYFYDDLHLSNQDRFFHLNGLASGNSPEDQEGQAGSVGGPISLTEITVAGLSELNARSRIDAETGMTESHLFKQFVKAVEYKGFFKQQNPDEIGGDLDNNTSHDKSTYEERYQKVVTKFRTKLAVKAENYSMFPRGNSGGELKSPFNPIMLNNTTAYQNNNINPPDVISTVVPHNEYDLNEAEALKNEGNVHMQVKDYSKAVESYTQALRLLPTGPQSHVYFSNRAAAYLSLKKFKEAIEDSERSLALKPDYGKAHARLGLAHFLTEDYESAIDAYKRSLKYEPDNKNNMNYLDRARRRLKQQQKQNNTSSISGSGTPSGKKSSRGRSKQQQHNNEDDNNNIIDQREADQLKIDGNNYMSSKKYDAAVNCYSAAIALVPSGPSSHVYYSNRAAALCYLERYQEAEMDSQQSIHLNPNYAKAYSRLGLSLFFMENYEGAIKAYSKALELEPNNNASRSYLAKAEKKLKEMQRSSDMY